MELCKMRKKKEYEIPGGLTCTEVGWRREGVEKNVNMKSTPLFSEIKLMFKLVQKSCVQDSRFRE
jgi:hypothetical protein